MGTVARMSAVGTHRRYVAWERARLAETLDRVGPGAPTLCEGWASEHLAAHLVVRERQPLAAVGNVVPALSSRTERVQRGMAEARVAAGDYAGLVEEVRQGPQRGPLRWARVDEAANLVEFFVHHEDLLRARDGWSPRVLEPGHVEALWRRARVVARLRRPHRDGTTVLRAPEHGAVTVGSGAPVRTVTGAPEELLLWLFGRHGVARVAAEP